MNTKECCFCENAHTELRAVLGGGGWCKACAKQIGQGDLWGDLPIVKAVTQQSQLQGV